MNKRDYFIAAWICIMLISLILTAGCTTNPPTNSNPTPSEPYTMKEGPDVEKYDVNDFVKEQLVTAKEELLRAAGAYGSKANILAVGVIHDYLLTENNVVNISSIADNLHIILSCALEQETDIAIKLLVDYQEQQFYVDGTRYDTYVFRVNPVDVVEVTFQLANQEFDMDKSHTLTIAAIPDAYSNVGTDSVLLQRDAYSVDYELTNPDSERGIDKLSTAEVAERLLNIPYQGIMLNTDFDAKDAASVDFPPKTISVKAGEIVKLAYRAGNYENTDSIVFYVFVGLEQLSTGGKKFFHIVNQSGKISFGTFDFVAPRKAGKYNVVAFVSAAPHELRNADNAHMNDCSRRFTLIVE